MERMIGPYKLLVQCGVDSVPIKVSTLSVVVDTVYRRIVLAVYDDLWNEFLECVTVQDVLRLIKRWRVSDERHKGSMDKQACGGGTEL